MSRTRGLDAFQKTWMPSMVPSTASRKEDVLARGARSRNLNLPSSSPLGLPQPPVELLRSNLNFKCEARRGALGG